MCRYKRYDRNIATTFDMKKNDTLLRHWNMLKLIPRYPIKITSLELHRHLQELGFLTSKRSIERDLNTLSIDFPIFMDDRSRPFGWSWQKDAASFDIPNLSINEAFLLVVADQNLSRLLSKKIKRNIDPYFTNAYKILNNFAIKSNRGNLSDKFKIIESFQQLLPPEINVEVHNELTHCLFNDEKIYIHYKNRDSETHEFICLPLALIQKGALLYLYVGFDEKKDGRILAVNRIIKACRAGVGFVRKKTLNIDKKIKEGRFHYGFSGCKIKIELEISPETNEHLSESKLSHDQVITPIKKSHKFKLFATVPYNEQLVWWILAHGNNIVVHKPSSLRKQIKIALQLAISQYS